MRVLVGMSGGVDSSVAAARLIDAGHDVTGVHLALTLPQAEGRGCALPTAQADAERVAAHLGMPWEVWDLTAEFAESVVEPFLAEYAAGRTPNPCLRCNATIKFAAMLDRGLARGFDALATGHYANVSSTAREVALHRAADETKDQSYVLGVLTQDQLRRVLFPLGPTLKEEVRREAVRRGLPTAARPDSVDLCFVPDGDVTGFLARRLGDRPGTIEDVSGEVVGSHHGTHLFTIGQRRGLRLGRPAPDGRPRFVIDLDPATNTVRVGPHDRLRVGFLACGPASWTQGPPSPFDGLVQVRAHGAALPARIEPADGRVDVMLGAPTYGVAPGQRAVFYDADRVVGSATIDATGV